MIYLVEDDPAVAELIGRTLQKYDFRCRHFDTGNAFLRQLRSESPQLVILDLQLPDMDALQIVSQLRAAHRFGLMIVTGRDDSHDRVLGLELGADDYVTKPFEPRELIARVRSVLRRYQAPPDPARQAVRRARFAGWRFDLGTYQLCSPDGDTTTLSQAEAQLLTVMLEHPNQILSRDQLLDGRNVVALDRSIDLRISRLRRRLEDNPQHARLIKTVYGAGYLFSAQVDWE
ncbi:response regulator transcription factor [Nitrogeniibacter mangrovi]|uniref:Response regulator transcription factor n=1 Tax=Nitrogeniibacter mangrovi TaxID=2016596 RepID=A0A6C1B8R4_9RHOO|nr:response regulator transcription factor [Nitrogeniibacter mangrovi]